MKSLRWMTVVLLLLVVTLPVPVFAKATAIARPLVVDVRTEPEWNEGHLEGAILIPYDKIGEGIVKAAPDKKTKIHLYCRSGRRSGIALDVLKKLGYEDVTNNGSVKDAAEMLKIPVVKDPK